MRWGLGGGGVSVRVAEAFAAIRRFSFGDLGALLGSAACLGVGAACSLAGLFDPVSEAEEVVYEWLLSVAWLGYEAVGVEEVWI